jgi:hypothetical protein
MSKIKSEIECLNRLHQMTGCLEDIMEFLHQEGMLSKEDIKGIRMSPEMAKRLRETLAQLSTDGKLQLLEYEWSILPVERINVLIVTNRMTRNFSYNV